MDLLAPAPDQRSAVPLLARRLPAKPEVCERGNMGVARLAALRAELDVGTDVPTGAGLEDRDVASVFQCGDLLGKAPNRSIRCWTKPKSPTR